MYKQELHITESNDKGFVTVDKFQSWRVAIINYSEALLEENRPTHPSTILFGILILTSPLVVTSLIGYPQLMHVRALSLICLPHSGHMIIAI